MVILTPSLIRRLFFVSEKRKDWTSFPETCWFQDTFRSLGECYFSKVSLDLKQSRMSEFVDPLGGGDGIVFK